MNGQRVGYVRVSTIDQKTDRQLEGEPLDRIFADKASGKDVKRPQLEAMLMFVREGDTVVVHSMDRLARNLGDLLNIVQSLTKRGVRVEFKKENLTFTGEDSPFANLMLDLLGSVAEFERALIRERQREGVAIAKREGKYHGRKPVLTPAQVVEVRQRLASGANKRALAEELGVSHETIYKQWRRARGEAHTEQIRKVEG